MIDEPDCEGGCSRSRGLLAYGTGGQVRYNPIAKMNLCADCQDAWSQWWVEGFSKPRWVPKGSHRPGEAR